MFSIEILQKFFNPENLHPDEIAEKINIPINLYIRARAGYPVNMDIFTRIVDIFGYREHAKILYIIDRIAACVDKPLFTPRNLPLKLKQAEIFYQYHRLYNINKQQQNQGESCTRKNQKSKVV